MTRATLKAAIRAIRAAAIPLELVRGEGYHYFIFDDGARWETVSVMVPYTNSLSTDRWVEEAKSALQTIQKDFA